MLGEQMNIILASASPRRKEILENHFVYPIIIPSETDETLPLHMEFKDVTEIVKYLAFNKANAVFDFLYVACNKIPNYKDISSNPEVHKACELILSGEKVIILGADTVVYKNSIIGKPKDEDDAFSILSSLRNTSHHVYTGVSMIEYNSEKHTELYEDTLVYFNDYSDEEIRRFIKEEPPYDKSGSYAIQSSWSKNVDRVEGDIENVIGLPWKKIEEYLNKMD